MKDIIYSEGRNYTWEVKERQRIPIELSLFMMRSFIFVQFFCVCANAQTTLTCCVATLACLVLVSQRSEPQQFRIIAHPTSNQLKSCFCARSWTSRSSLVLPTLTLVRAILCKRVKAVTNCSFFQIHLSISQALSSFFSNFHGERHVFMGLNAARFL